MTGQWLLWAQRDTHRGGPQAGEVFFMNFGSREHVTRGYGGDVVPLRVTEDSEGQYWGWIDNEDWRAERGYRSNDGVPTFIQPHHGMFTMQFPYGPEAEQERGRGHIVRLVVEDLTAVDLDDTTSCPQASSCFSCTEVHDDDQLAVATYAVAYTTPVGVVCVTMCGDCVETGPDLHGWGAAAEMALEHAGHLGINADEMGALMEMER